MMKTTGFTAAALLSASLLLFAGCKSYEYSLKKSGETVAVQGLNYEKPLSLSKVIDKNNPNVSRGFITTDLLIEGGSLALQGVKQLIKASRGNYTQTYSGGLANEFFYAKTSTVGMLDPQNIQFRGFEITRTFKDKKTGIQTAVYLRCLLDENRLQELYHNSRFYMVVDSVSIVYSKVKLDKKSWYMPWTWFIKNKKDFNLDMEILFNAGWVNHDATIIENRQMGRFMLNLRDIPLGTQAAGEYFKALKGKPLDGFSYLIPRGSAFCRNQDGEYQTCFGRGQFNIVMKATESSKEGTVSKMIIDNADQIDQIKKKDIESIVKKLKP